MAVGSVLDPEPVLDIGGTRPDGQSVLLDPRTVTRAGELLVISDYQAAAVRFFDLRGRLVRSAGREGAGPGEFRRLSAVRSCTADSVFAYDSRLHRMTVIDTAGTFVREYRTPVLALNIVCSRTGVVVVQMHSPGSWSASGSNDVQYSSILLTDTRGDTIAILDSIRLGDRRPLGTLTTVAAADDRVYVGTADSAWVDVYSMDGRVQNRIRTGTQRREVTSAMHEAYVDGLLEGMYRDNPEQRAEYRKQFLNMPTPGHSPAYRRVLAAPNATLWVDMTVPGDSVTWLRVLAPHGSLVGDVRLPRGVEPLEVDDEFLFVRYEDGEGEPHVALYRLTAGR